MEKGMSIKKDDVKTRTEVEEIENGYLIIRHKEWDDEKGWHHESKKFFSEDNPLDDVEKSLVDSFKDKEE